MSFFAILDAQEFAERSNFEVERLHLNLWSLAAVGIHRRMFFLDVGINIRASRHDVKQITVALPFDTREPESLHEKVLDRKLASLIFDRQIEVHGDQIRYGTTVLNTLEAATHTAEKVETFTQRGFSVWNIPLTKPVPARKSAYIRVRFPISDTGRTWRWTRSRLRRDGAIFDFRISDIRSSRKVPGASELLGRIRPIRSVAAFVMAPLWLHTVTLNPEPRYIRLLEGKVWADYLDRAPELSQRSRLIVYYWRSPGDGPVDAENPMRAFANFQVRGNTVAVRTVALAAVVFVALAWLLYGLPIRTEIIDAIRGLWEGLIKFLLPGGLGVALTATIMLAGVATVVQLFGWWKIIRKWSRDRFHDFEDRLFRILRDVGPRD